MLYQPSLGPHYEVCSELKILKLSGHCTSGENASVKIKIELQDCGKKENSAVSLEKLKERDDTCVNTVLCEEFQGSLSLSNALVAETLDMSTNSDVILNPNVEEDCVPNLITHDLINICASTEETERDSLHKDNSDTYSDLYSEVETDEEFEEDNDVLLIRSKTFREKCNEGECNHRSSLDHPEDDSLKHLEPSTIKPEKQILKKEADPNPEKQNIIIVDDDHDEGSLSEFIQVQDQERVPVGPHLRQTGGNCFIMARTEDGDLYSVDLECLRNLRRRPGASDRECWLSSAIVEFMVAWTVKELVHIDDQAEVSILPSQLLQPGYARQTRILRNIIIFPMWKQGHFILMIYSRSEETLLLLDSLSMFTPKSQNVKKMVEYLRQNNRPATVRVPEEVSQQDNGSDCGVFVVLFLEEFLRSWKAGTKMRDMRFFVQKRKVEEKRETIFQILKAEGLRMNQNEKITAEDCDKMWFDP
jgi:hypothetical protein